MIEGDPAAPRADGAEGAAASAPPGEAGAGELAPTLTMAGLALRGLAGLAIVAGIAVSGLAIYHSQRDEPLPARIAAPQPHASAAPRPSPPPAAAAADAPSVDEVIARLVARLKDQPDDAEGWRMLGWSYFQNGRYAEAAVALRKANRLDPTVARTWSFLGEALVLASHREGRVPREARFAFAKALKLDPKDARARYFHAVALDLAGQHRRAIGLWLDQLADTPPDAPYAADIRAIIRTVGARHGIEVEKRLAEARFVAPGSDSGDSVGPSAAQLAAAGRLPPDRRPALIGKPLAALEAQLKARPVDPDGWITLMRGRTVLGDTKGAATAFAAALAACGKDKSAAQKLHEAGASLGLPLPETVARGAQRH